MTTTLSQLYSQAKTGNAPQDIGIGGFKLFANVSTSVDYDVDAPVSFLEDGTNVTDQLILKPIILNITGSVSDIFLGTGMVSSIENLVRRTQSEIGVVTKYLPARSKATEQRINTIIASINDAYDLLDTLNTEGEQLFNFFGDKTASSIQNSFFNFIDKVRTSKILINVQTRYRLYKNFAIVSVTPAYTNEIYATDFSMRLQEIRFVTTQSSKTAVDTKNAAAGTGGDVSNEKDKGPQAGAEPTSFLYTAAKKSGFVK